MKKIGRVVNDKKALKKCRCRKVNPHQKDSKMFCYSEGVVGTLDEGQVEECGKIDMLPTSKTQQRHYEKFQELGQISTVCLKSDEGETTEAFFRCIEHQAKERI